MRFGDMWAYYRVWDKMREAKFPAHLFENAGIYQCGFNFRNVISERMPASNDNLLKAMGKLLAEPFQILITLLRFHSKIQSPSISEGRRFGLFMVY